MEKLIMNKFNIGDKVWFKLDSYGKKAERYGTIRSSLNIGDGWRYNIETSDHQHWNIQEKDINYSAPHTRETLKNLLNRVYGNPDFKPFLLGDLVMYKDAPKPDTFTVIDILESKNPIGDIVSYAYRIKRKAKNGKDIVHIAAHDKLVKVQFKGLNFIPEKYDDVAVPFELSEEEKEYVRNDVATTMSYIHELHKNGFYGLDTDLTIEVKNGSHIFVNKEDNKMKNQQQKKRNRNIIKTEKYQRTIKDITFNGPAVIVQFEPTGEDLAWCRTKGDKVVVVCKDGDKYDMKTGFLLAILKEFMNNQSYGNILEKLDSFDALDIPQVGKESIFKFKVGDIVRFEHGVARFKVDKCTTFTTSSGKVVPRYRILRILGESKYAYSAYANENELILADEVYRGDK